MIVKRREEKIKLTERKWRELPGHKYGAKRFCSPAISKKTARDKHQEKKPVEANSQKEMLNICVINKQTTYFQTTEQRPI